MVVGWVRSRTVSGRVRGLGVVAGAAALALGGCAGSDMLKLPGLGASSSALNVPVRPEAPERAVSPAD